jgi:large subunit ribosomal protein L24
MVDKTQNWSKEWKASEQPSKQRKYRRNAPQHVKDNMISANLSHELRGELDTRNIQLNLGDRVEVMRGDFSGSSGIVSNIDRDRQKVYINGLEVEKQDGTLREVAFKPSNLQIQALNLENMERIEKYDVEDADEIQVDEEEVEEVLEEDEENEMMQQMQGGGAQPSMDDMDIDEEDMEDIKEAAEEVDTDEDESSQEGSPDSKPSEETGNEEDPVEEMEEDLAEDIVSGTIGDAKEAIQELESPDYEELIAAEKAGKDRKTMIEYLENQKEEK